jgi:hypothetical protein
MALTLLEPIIVNTAANFTFANASVTSNITAGNVKTDNLLYANGSPYIFTTSAAGSNTQVQFNDANAFAGSANFTFNKTSNTLSVTNIVANGAGLTALNGSNITGQVANATVAGTVYSAAQPNITSVGLLTALSVGPNSGIILTGTSGYVRANSIQGTDGVNAIYPGYNGVTGSVGVTSNLTVGINSAGNITANGNVTASYFIGNGSSLTGLAAGNITGQVGNALVAGTVYTAAQPNITSVGTLTGLTSNGTINFTNASNVSLGAVGNVKITGGTTGQYLQTDGTGNLSWSTVISGGASNISNGTSNINIPVANGNITIGINGFSNTTVFSESGISIPGDAGNITGANYVIANYFTGNLVNSTANLTLLTVDKSIETIVPITGATGVVTHDFSTGGVFYHSSIAGSFTPNFTNVPATNNTITIIALVLNQGVTAYAPTGNIQIAGVNQTVKWSSGVVPSGTSLGIDSVSYALMRVGTSWVVTGATGSYS